jgi:hypothetical protein
MKKTMFLALVCFVLMIAGCATHKVQDTSPSKYYVIKSDDSQVSFEVASLAQARIDNVTVEPSRIIVAALAKELPSISSRFGSPYESAAYSERPKGEWATYMFGINFAVHNGNKLIIRPASTNLPWWKKAQEEKKYELFADLKFSCTGNKVQECSKKLADAFVETGMPKVKLFLSDLGY